MQRQTKIVSSLQMIMVLLLLSFPSFLQTFAETIPTIKQTSPLPLSRAHYLAEETPGSRS